MARDHKRIKKRNSNIEKKFNRLCKKTYNGKQVYRYEVILEKLADEFYLSAARIQDILKGK